MTTTAITTLTELTEKEFDAAYHLLTNPHASWAFGDAPGCLFETYGEEFAFVRLQNPLTIWTLTDGEDGDLYLISGLHFVNRVGYLISREAVPPHTTVQVHIPMDEE